MTHSSIPSAIVFDLDGTLVDSLPDMLGAVNRLLADLDRPPAEASVARRWVGEGAAALVERAVMASGGLPEGRTIHELVVCYVNHYRGHAAIHSRPYDGVVETLHALKAAGHRLAVCTNKPYDLAVELISALGWTPFFAAVLGGDSVAEKKPAPLHLQATLEAMGADVRRTVMVGDSIADVLAAKGVGVPVVAVSFGYSRVAPTELGADALIDHFAELPAVVDRFLALSWPS